MNKNGSASDENHLLNKSGERVWITGEAVLIRAEGHGNIVKVIHILHAESQLHRHFVDPDVLIENIFDTIKSKALLILDLQMNVLKVNKAFMLMFEILELPDHQKLFHLPHSFWQDILVKGAVVKAIVNNIPVNDNFSMQTKSSEQKIVKVVSKWIVNPSNLDKQILLMMNEPLLN